MEPVSLEKAIQNLINIPEPILFCDTSSLLDIIRIPFREKTAIQALTYLNNVKVLSEHSQNKNMHIIMPPPVIIEWNKNAQKVISYIDNEIINLDRQMVSPQAIAKYYDPDYQVNTLKPLELSSQLYNLCKNIIDSAIKITKDKEITLIAYDRNLRYEAPARKGAANDCLLYEHSLHIMTELRKHNSEVPLVFLTSNTKDFCETSGLPQEPINTELATLDAKLTTNWNWAKHELGF